MTWKSEGAEAIGAHSPGVFRAHIVEGPARVRVATVFGKPSNICESRARLIEAAPLMADALRQLTDPSADPDAAQLAGRAALAAAGVAGPAPAPAAEPSAAERALWLIVKHSCDMDDAEDPQPPDGDAYNDVLGIAMFALCQINGIDRREVEDRIRASRPAKPEPAAEAEDRSRCQNCDWTGPDEDLRAIQHIHQRVMPGEPMPSGECPTCGALCQPIKAGA